MAIDRQAWTATARAALGLFRRKQWASALVAVIVLSGLFVQLGRWQFHRHEQRTARAAVLDRNYGAAPVSLGELRWRGHSLPSALEWRAVRVTGSYQADRTLLARNRPLNGANGYEVLVPLRTDDGRVLLVDRGWVAAGATGAEPDAVPAPPSGPVTVVARLRRSEEGVKRQPPAGQVMRIDVPSIASSLGEPLVGAYGVLASESPAPATAPTPIPRPDPGLDINLPYAIQWWIFAVAAYVLLGWGAVREVRRSAADRTPKRGAPDRSRSATPRPPADRTASAPR